MHKNKKIKIIVSIVFISFIQGLQYCVSPVLGDIQNHFSGVNVILIQMLVTVPSFIAMIIAILSGWIVTKISKKKLLIFAGFVAGITGFIPFLNDNFGLLFFSRAFYGIGMGLATTLNVAVVAEFFDGDERVSVMGIQAASVGTGMAVVTTLAGQIGTFGFQHAYYVNIIGFIAAFLIALMLPETGVVKITPLEKIRLNKEVFKISFWGFLEFLFLITFTTNISMHISGQLAGNSGVSGILTGIFSVSQIIIGMILGFAVKIFRKYTLPAAMLFFTTGTVILVCFSSRLPLLIIGAVLCGFSQGMFIPQAMVDISNAVKPVSTAMAAACFTCLMSFGQVVSPTIMNAISMIIFGSVTTSRVYSIAGIGMLISACFIIISKSRSQIMKGLKQRKDTEK
jgi:MFS family permease